MLAAGGQPEGKGDDMGGMSSTTSMDVVDDEQAGRRVGKYILGRTLGKGVEGKYVLF